MRSAQKPSSSRTILAAVVVVVLVAAGGIALLLGGEGEPAEEVDVPALAGPVEDPGAPAFDAAPPPERTAQPIPLQSVDLRAREPGRELASAGLPTGCIEGRVTNAAGQPVPGVELSTYLGNAFLRGTFPGARQAIDVRGRSDGEGRFKLCEVPEGDHLIVVGEHDDYARSEAPPVPVRRDKTASGLNLVMDDGAVISGTVTSDGAGPLMHARVELYYQLDMAFRSPDEQKPFKIVFTDATGRYAFTHVSPTSVRLRCSADDHETQSRAITYALEARTKDEVIDFNLAFGAALPGRVVDAFGAPVAGARVEANSQTKDAQGHALAFSGDDGFFLLDGMGESRYQVRTSKPGYSDFTKQNVHISAGSLQIVLERRGDVSGRVTTGDGRPVTSFSLHLMRSRAGSDPHYLNAGREFVAPDGRFTFGNLDPGDYVLEARADGLADTKSDPFTIVRDEPTPELPIVMSRGGTLAGIVRDASGAPAAGAKVALNPNNYVDSSISQIFKQLAPSDERELLVVTDKAGAFEFENIPPGTYQIAASHPGSADRVMNSIAVRADDQGGNPKLDVGLPPGATIAGRALDLPGGPLPFCKVQLNLADNSYMSAGTTDKDGYFAFGNLRPGNYRISVSPTKIAGEVVHPFIQLVHAKKSEQELYVGEGQRVDGLVLQLKTD